MLTKKSSLCRAKNPATCRVHGTPFSSSYDTWVQDHKDVEPAVVFKNVTLPSLNFGSNYPLFVMQGSEGMSIYFSVEGNRGWLSGSSDDNEAYIITMRTNSNTEELLAELDEKIAKKRKFAGLPLQSKEDKQKLKQYEILKKTFADDGIHDLEKRQKAIDAVNKLDDVRKDVNGTGDGYRVSYTAMVKSYHYGKQLDTMSEYSEQEKAVILTQSLEANDKIYHSDYGTPDYHEDVKRNWTVYKTFATEYQKSSK